MIDQSIYSGPVFEIARKQFVESQTTSTSLQMKENGFSTETQSRFHVRYIVTMVG
jgi:hypothetical protein